MPVGLLIFALLAGSLCALEWRWPARAQKRWRRGMWTDLAFWLATPIVARVVAVVAAIGVALLVAPIAGVPLDRAHVTAFVNRPTWLKTLPLAVQAIALLLAGDLLAYWLHRLGHRRPLWRFHQLHHSSQDLDWLSSVRVHPIDTLASRAVGLIPFLALGFDARVIGLYLPLLPLHALLIHANVPWTFGRLRYVISSPAFHRWHHSAARDCNFAGFFPVWDLVFGTFYVPAAQPDQFGVRSAGASTASPQ